MAAGRRLTVCLSVLLIPVCLSLAAGPAQAQAAEDPPVSCQELRDLGYQVSLTDKDLLGEDETRFCLIARPEEDTFTGYVMNVFTVEDFRAVKQLYAGLMISQNYDVCRIGLWRPLTRGDRPTLTAADQLDLPTACLPRVVARDRGGANLIGAVEVALQQVADRTTVDLGFRPRRPLTVEIYTETPTLTAALLAARPDYDSEAAAQLIREGRSLTITSATRGLYIVLNVTRLLDASTLTRRLAHEYTHFVQSASAGTLDSYPVWFLEGQAELQMARIGGEEWDRRADAARREQGGVAPRLTELVTPEAWSAVEARAGSQAVYSRSYMALALITERWGYGATLRLFNAGSDTDPGRFDRVLREITGTDTEGLDRLLTTLLRSIGGSVTFFNDSPLAQQLIFPDGRVVDLPACATCAFLRAGESCRDDGRPSARLDLPAGDYDILRVVPADRIHFPDRTIRIRIEPSSVLIRPLCLLVV